MIRQKLIILCFIILWTAPYSAVFAQQNILAISVNGFSFYDQTSFQFSNQPDLPIPLNLSYERLSGDYGFRLKFGGYDLAYSADERDEIGRRKFALISLSGKRYFPLTDALYVYPVFQLALRFGEEEWYLRRDHWGEVFIDAIYGDPGLGLGGGIQYELFDLIILEGEVKHSVFLHAKGGDNDILHDSDDFEGVGSEHQFSLVLSAGVLF